ncbi:MerR family transcriptional regulator [Prauserella muralis]|uniref:Mercuric resistance operon regulatory protein n=1 Tax=Prauserella muralis TaxID=588067 RepID=A0A2V4BC85_9PSEU|nr:MerR family DNA-binding protein [Prauserella muralis]PXY32122.1 heavy metal-responsive transcriptional regulator [Prauserella muralis]TWE24228.1 Hg(II)-responsive transcriptional regulator [Prauserella muralis]
MRSSEVAARAGVHPQTLRYYERRGLVSEPPRTATGYRVYPAAAVSRVRFVKRAQELGFTLDEVRDLLHLADGGPDDCDSARALARSRLRALEARIADLHRMRESLVELVETCERPRRDRRCPLLDALQTGRKEA